MTRDAFPTFAVDLAVASTAAERPNSLDGIDTSPLKSGALGWVDSGAAAGTLFRLDRDDSSTTPNGTSVVQPLVGPGRWKALVGGVINGQGEVLTDTASATPPAGGVRLEDVDTTIVPDGTRAYVRSVEDQYVLDKQSTLTPDGITVVQPTSGTGLWVRRNDGNERWRRQAEWHINANSGGDENAGDAANPLASWAELARRLGPDPRIPQSVDVSIESDLAETLTFLGVCRLAVDVIFAVRGGVKNTLQTGTFAAVTSQNRGTQTMMQLQDTGLDAFVDNRIRITDGAAAGATTWGVRTPGPDQLDCVQSVTFDDTAVPIPLNGTPATPGVGDGYAVEELFEVDAVFLRFAGEGDFSRQPLLVDLKVLAGPFRYEDSPNNSQARMARCHVSALSGNGRPFAISCFADIQLHTEATGSYDACLMRARGSGFMTVIAGFFEMRGDTIVHASRLVISSNSGHIQLLACAVFDSPEYGILCGAITRVRTDGSTVWGNGNTDVGIEVRPGAQVAYELAKPTITGAVDDTRIAGTLVSYASIPSFDTAYGAGITDIP